MPHPLNDKVREVVTPVVQGAGYELVDVEWKHEQGGWVIRLFIDKPDGISHEDCEQVSRQVSATLDVHDVVPHTYNLEVSSPGLDRPLRTSDHFRRFVGQKARVKLRDGLEGRRNFSGVIVSAEDSAVTMEVDGKQYTLPLSDLEKANLDWQFQK
jgi:ribosome maturation factor RimP